MEVKNPLDELRDTQLFRYLKGLSEEYAQNITAFVAEIAPILDTTRNFFPYYTRHDAHHSYRIIRRIEQILKPDCLHPDNDRSLRSAEVFLLIASAHAHDLGMTVFPGEEGKLIKDLCLPTDHGWKTNPILQDYLRKNHSIRGGEYIHLNADRLCLPVNLVAPLDWMMRSHNLSIPELDRNLSSPFAAQERVIDVRQLSIILCIADAVEFSDTRVVDGVIDAISADIGPAARLSYRENMKHVCIGDSLAIDGDGRIIVSGTFAEPDVLSLAHHTFDQIEEWIRGYCDIDRRSAVHRLKVRPEPIQRRLELPGGSFDRLGVRINKRNVIELIASNAIWKSNPGAPLRELLQNAVEACRYRKFHSAPSDHYTPKVYATFDRSAKTITVRDNGCGMSERVVLNHFLTVGNSRAREKAYASEEYAPIARFGVGFWSVFTIAERAHIETAAFEDVGEATQEGGRGKGIAFDIALDDLKDYTVFADRELPGGTTVTIHLKPTVTIDDVYQRARGQLLCSEVEILLALDDEIFAIPPTVPVVSEADILENRQRLKDDLGVRVFQWQGTLGETELALGFAYRMVDGHPSFLSDDPQRSLVGVLPPIRMPKTAVCGFQVALGRFLQCCFDLMRVGTYFANYRTPRGIEFSIDRQALLLNGAARQFINEIEHMVHDAFREFLRKTGAQDSQSIFMLNEQSRMNGGNVFDTTTGNELAVAFANYADLLCFKLIEVQPGKSFGEASPQFVDLRALATMSGTIWLSQNPCVIPGGGGPHVYIEPEHILPGLYEYAKHRLSLEPRAGKVFVLGPNRPASMLFDADPESTVEFLQATRIGNVRVQRVTLPNIRFAEGAQNILAEVQGRWTGAIYLRDFTAPDGKPYVFLGRHRVLIQKSSRLKNHLEALNGQGRLMKLAETVALLKEDEAGYAPAEIADLVTEHD